MLDNQSTGLMIIDVQGKLAELMHNSSALLTQLRILIEGAQLLGLPIVWLEQLPDKLGVTRPEIRECLPGSPLVKNTFSGMANAEIAAAVRQTGCQQWLVAGIEAHICVYQTVAHLLEQGFRVELVTDAVSSRTANNCDLGIRKMSSLGAGLTSVEMALMELQVRAEGDCFRQLVKLIK